MQRWASVWNRTARLPAHPSDSIGSLACSSFFTLLHFCFSPKKCCGPASSGLCATWTTQSLIPFVKWWTNQLWDMYGKYSRFVSRWRMNYLYQVQAPNDRQKNEKAENRDRRINSAMSVFDHGHMRLCPISLLDSLLSAALALSIFPCNNNIIKNINWHNKNNFRIILYQ